MGCRGGCVKIIEVIVKKKSRGGGGSVGCVQRIEVIVKMPKKWGGSGRGGVRVDVYN